jgi:hypothetical protein
MTSLLVNPSGEVSNFLQEDYEGVLIFMKSEKQKKQLRI